VFHCKPSEFAKLLFDFSFKSGISAQIGILNSQKEQYRNVYAGKGILSNFV
jgi:hypothetical protein